MSHSIVKLYMLPFDVFLPTFMFTKNTQLLSRPGSPNGTAEVVVSITSGFNPLKQQEGNLPDCSGTCGVVATPETSTSSLCNRPEVLGCFAESGPTALF